MINILLVGCCGSGKTWVMKQLIKKYKAVNRVKLGKFYYHANSSVGFIGKYDGSTFEGSDRLSMSVITDIDLFLQYAKLKVVVYEGDRFTNSTFIQKAKPYIIKITDDGSAGRIKRNSQQTERHIKSIATRVSNIKSDYELDNSEQALQHIIKLIDKNE